MATFVQTLPQLLLTSLVLSETAAGAGDSKTVLQAFEDDLREILEQGEGRALAGVVVRGRDVLWQGGIGTADLGRGTAATSQTIFQLASAGKVMTGLALCDLALSGKLDLNDQVASLAPELPIDNPFPGRPLRVRHLLEHSSGIQEIIPRWYDERVNPLLPVIKLITRTLPRIQVRWPPGERNIYSNFNYVASAHLIEKLTGEPFDLYIARRFFGPLNMTGASYRLHADPRRQVARGYSAGSSAPLPNTLGIHRVAAGMAASAEDLGKLLIFLLEGDRLAGSQVVPFEIFRLMEKIETGPSGRKGLAFGHGAGVVARRMHGYRFFGHNGIVDGFTATLFYSREANFGFAFLANAHPLPHAPSLMEARDAAFKHFLPHRGQAAEPPRTARPETFTGVYQVEGSRFAQLAGLDRLFASKWLDADNIRGLADATLGIDARGRTYLFHPPTTYRVRVSLLAFLVRTISLGLATAATLTIPAYVAVAIKYRQPFLPALLFGLFTLGVFSVGVALYHVRTSEVALQLNALTGSIFVGSLLMYAAAWTSLIGSLWRLGRSRGPRDWWMLAAASGATVVMETLRLWGLIGVRMWDGGGSILDL